MHAHRDVYLKVVEITKEHGSLPPSHFLDYLGHWYGTTQAAAVRRQADTDPRVVSLARLMTEIRDDPTRITRDWFMAHYNDFDQRRGLETWHMRFGGEVGEHVDPANIVLDLETLADTARRVSEFVDRHVAHTDLKPLKISLTFDEVDAAIDGISEMFQKYMLLLTNSQYAFLVPAFQYDWLAIFREPWIKQEGGG